jgi:hypothetical protein
MRRMFDPIDFLSCLVLVACVILGPAVAVRAQDAAGPAPSSTLLKITHVSIGVTAGLMGADLAQSMYLLGQLRTQQERQRAETNLLYVPFDNKPALAGGVKAGLGALSGWALVKYQDDHPKLVLVTSLALNGFFGWVVDHNRRVTAVRP